MRILLPTFVSFDTVSLRIVRQNRYGAAVHWDGGIVIAISTQSLLANTDLPDIASDPASFPSVPGHVFHTKKNACTEL